MSDFGEQVNYEQFQPIIHRKGNCNTFKLVSSVFGISFMCLMLYMMVLMVQILQNMDVLMKSTTTNTYGMCKLTKALAMDNTTICMKN